MKRFLIVLSVLLLMLVSMLVLFSCDDESDGGGEVEGDPVTDAGDGMSSESEDWIPPDYVFDVKFRMPGQNTLFTAKGKKIKGVSGINLSEEKRQELIERCYSNNERLRRLLNDVSLITRIEDGSALIGKERVEINDIIIEVAKELEMLPNDERLLLHTDFSDKVIIDGNPSLIGSIFSNLTENAIAYSEGRNIYISLLENNEKQCRIRFEDDGKGVEQEQLPHLFERFYRVDKGRSRKKGGTGLGLAVVKHAVQFHGGTITATNRPNGGLRFDFTLNKHDI